MKLSFSTGSSGSPGKSSAMGKGCGTLFFGLFFVMGALFTAFMLVETWKQLEPWWWPEARCTIVASEVIETGGDEKPYRAVVRFQYEIDGRVFEGDRFTRSDDHTASFDRARDRAAGYPPGTAASCRVSPDNPSKAVLERQMPWIALVIFFPLIFVAIGGGGLYALWKGSRSDGTEEVTSISQTASRGKAYKAIILFGLLFVVVGGAVFVPLTALPAIRFVASMSWEPTPCTIVNSRLRSWSTDDGTSYRADVLYQYQSGGRDWTSNRVVFFGFVNSGRDAARAILDRHPDGAADSCWVNPKDPSKSVLERKLRPHHLIGLAPLVFVIIGWALAYAGWKKMRARQGIPEARIAEALSAGEPLQLEPQVGPVGKVLGALFFTVIWNGIVSVFVWRAFKVWEQGQPDWFLTIFLVPFVLVGIFSVGFLGRTLLALANPRPRLTLTPGSPRLGESLRLEWKFTGRNTRLGHLRIFLEGREEATYRRGTKTHTDCETFATLDLVDSANDWEIPRGTTETVVPDDTMHSFEGESNKIVWEIKVEGDIARWPDVEQNFPIRIRPMRVGKG